MVDLTGAECQSSAVLVLCKWTPTYVYSPNPVFEGEFWLVSLKSRLVRRPTMQAGGGKANIGPQLFLPASLPHPPSTQPLFPLRRPAGCSSPPRLIRHD